MGILLHDIDGNCGDLQEALEALTCTSRSRSRHSNITRKRNQLRTISNEDADLIVALIASCLIVLCLLKNP